MDVAEPSVGRPGIEPGTLGLRGSATKSRARKHWALVQLAPVQAAAARPLLPDLLPDPLSSSSPRRQLPAVSLRLESGVTQDARTVAVPATGGPLAIARCTSQQAAVRW